MNPSKEQLYGSICGNVAITQHLQDWLRKICIFCEKILVLEGRALTNENIAFFFSCGTSTIEMAGYVPISLALLQHMIESQQNINQRVLLTTILRFLKHFAKCLWLAISRHTSMSEMMSVLDNTLDAKEVERHIRFVLHKHGINTGTSGDVVSQLHSVFDIEGFNRIINDTTYPSITTSLTQPIGTDIVASIMSYRYNGMSTRIGQAFRRYINVQTLATYGAQLCPLEISIIGQNITNDILPWQTGAYLYAVNPLSDFAYLVTKYKKFHRCGPSCTTQMMLDAALLFGMDVHHVFMAIIPWMEIAKDHSLFEMLIVANAYLPFDEYQMEEEQTFDDLKERTFVAKMYNTYFQGSVAIGGKIDKYNKNRIDNKRKMKGSGPSLDDYDRGFKTSTNQLLPAPVSTSTLLFDAPQPESHAVFLDALASMEAATTKQPSFFSRQSPTANNIDLKNLEALDIKKLPRWEIDTLLQPMKNQVAMAAGSQRSSSSAKEKGQRGQ
jgi:hypothetical protein